MIAGTSGGGEEKFPPHTEKLQLVDRREKVSRCDTTKEMEWRREQRKTQRAEAAHGMVEGKRQGRLDGDVQHAQAERLVAGPTAGLHRGDEAEREGAGAAECD